MGLDLGVIIEELNEEIDELKKEIEASQKDNETLKSSITNLQLGKYGVRYYCDLSEVQQIRAEKAEKLSEERRLALERCSPFERFQMDSDGAHSHNFCEFCSPKFQAMHEPDCDYVRLTKKEEE